MKKFTAIVMIYVVSLLTGACRDSAPEGPDTVVTKVTPDHSKRNCWELRIAKGGSDAHIRITCVDQDTWNQYEVGEEFTH